MGPRHQNSRVGQVVIANGGTVSTAIDLEGRRFRALMTPASFTGASVSFQVSADGVTYKALYNEATLYSINVGVDRWVAVNPVPFCGFNYIKVVSAGAEAAERTIVMAGNLDE